MKIKVRDWPQINARVPPALFAALKQLAVDNGRSVASEARRALAKHVADEGERS